ncbi:hypothetical protein TRFO_30338 [Tritrichomonas foetus]|uniref:Uncharacterized protein n=1 Tax=Tritrichomonas foetus TaxID=1144522 RepID=A0A1J4JYA5_9EUKA|nr:hypothetical protein TRFO_30338 [Tritrichomonas foetus]|eukprot:OHT02508.1 hypothetical protein TRFO_30338 [Tritrichomonas foetus]
MGLTISFKICYFYFYYESNMISTFEKNCRNSFRDQIVSAYFLNKCSFRCSIHQLHGHIFLFHLYKQFDRTISKMR